MERSEKRVNIGTVTTRKNHDAPGERLPLPQRAQPLKAERDWPLHRRGWRPQTPSFGLSDPAALQTLRMRKREWLGGYQYPVGELLYASPSSPCIHRKLNK